jgi:hypothetical protein
MLVLVDLPLQLGQRDLGGVVAGRGLAQIPGLAIERVAPHEDDRAPGAAGQLLDVAAAPPPDGRHAQQGRRNSSHDSSHEIKQ